VQVERTSRFETRPRISLIRVSGESSRLEATLINVDEKTIIALAVGGLLTILGGMLTKTFEFILAGFQQKRDFRRFRREKAYAEIEELKNEIGWVYQMGVNWKPIESKLSEYQKMMDSEERIIGRYNKYPEIASTAKDVVHWCKIVCFGEREHSVDVVQTKKELADKYKGFLKACDEYTESLV